jgi:hypothetical protein
MKLKIVFLAMLIFIALVTYSISQNRPEVSVQPLQLERMRNMGLDTAKSGLPVSLPREWGRL